MRVTIAHEWLVRMAGSERVVEAMLRAFPDASLVTTLLDPSAVEPSLRRARTSPLQAIPGATAHHEWLLPLMPLAWKFVPAPPSDLVISSSHACARAVRVPDGARHLCYCHTPMRYAWDFESESGRFPRALRPAARLAMGGFRAWDRRTARHVDRFVANSTAVAERIRRFYGQPAEVIHPPVRTTYFTPGDERGDEFLYVGRLVSYKRPDLAVEAFADLPFRLNVVGAGHLEADLRRRATPNVTFLGQVGEEELRRRYRSARALVFPADEDFGIIMAEAQACGTPVVALRRGGALDIVTDGVTGWLVDRPDASLVRATVLRATREDLSPAVVRAGAERFSEERFVEEIQEAAAAVAGV